MFFRSDSRWNRSSVRVLSVLSEYRARSAAGLAL